MEIISFLALKSVALIGILFVTVIPVAFWAGIAWIIGWLVGVFFNATYKTCCIVMVAWALFTTPIMLNVSIVAYKNSTSPAIDTLFRGYEEHKDLTPVKINVTKEIRRYELVSWNPPKHFYVTLEDVKTQRVLRSLYVSKHCSGANSLKAGEEYNIPVITYSWSNDPTTIYSEFQDLKSVFCE